LKSLLAKTVVVGIAVLYGCLCVIVILCVLHTRKYVLQMLDYKL